MEKYTFIMLISTFFLPACQPLHLGFAQETTSKPPGFAAGPVNSNQDPGFIGARTQLTHVGPRSGEGYFSPDGKQMIFQSERDPANPFYQIFSLDLESGQTKLLSTGRGKTTCAWFHPQMKKALFSSTHLDPAYDQKVKEEFSSRKSQQKAKYAWSYDETYEIFEENLSSHKLINLTQSRGYDAEGSYSPDGKWIVFASNRTGYSEKLTEEESKLFAQDPSSQMELYLMRSDGTKVKRLTNHLGYDGGPFFSADGKQITWRRFSANGATAEIWVMNVDGSNQRQLTRLNAMSWAPFFHPSGDYIIFTTNKLGYSNFELYIVDARGEKDPIRVSYWEGFDGLPVFSPDGLSLSWTHRDEKGESQIFLANWDDKKAREFLGLSLKAPKLGQLKGGFHEQDARLWIQYLASQELAGRLTGSAEETRMAQELGAWFGTLGLQPEDGSNFVQSFDFTSGVEFGEKNSFALKTAKDSFQYKLEKDFAPLSFSKTGDFPQGDVAFAGYGLVAPASDGQPAYDSYRDLDVTGKWVLVFRDIPEEVPNARRIFLNQVSRLHHKALAARKAGAIGLLVAAGPQSSSQQKVAKLRFDGSFAEAGIPVISVSDEIAEKILANSGKSLKAWQLQLDKGEPGGVASIEDRRIQASVDLKDIKSVGHNTVAVLKAPGAKKTILIGAHGDHLGKGQVASSLARGSELGAAHVGADDNASGVAAVLQVAQALVAYQKHNPHALKYNIAFAIWSGEELGLLGSNAYSKRSAESLPVVYLNLDMVGRLRENLMVQGVGSAKEWGEIFESLALRQKMPLSLQSDPYLPTDSMSFYLKGVPTVTFFTGAHSEYHTPRDVAELINYSGLVSIARFVYAVTLDLSQKEKNIKLSFQKVESSKKQLEGRSFRVYLGTIPDYAQEKIKGVLISGTSKDSPAEKAGLLAGDVIRTLAGTKIENLYDYVYVLQGLKPNQKVNVEVQRNGKNLNLELTPGLKE